MASSVKCVTVIIVLIKLINRSNGFNCEKIHSCKCKLDDGTVIDLSPIGQSGGEPRFKNVPDTGGAGDTWSYNPCYGFTENSCNDVAACQIRNGAGFNAGTQDTAQFIFDEQNGMSLVYSATTDGVLRTTHTYLQCNPDEEGALGVVGEIIPDGNYFLFLESRYACPSADSSSGGSGLSGGSILLIIVVVFIFVYIVGGILFQTFVRKSEGVERVPNLSLWTSLPGLIKDGFQFTFKTMKEKAGYQSI